MAVWISANYFKVTILISKSSDYTLKIWYFHSLAKFDLLMQYGQDIRNCFKNQILILFEGPLFYTRFLAKNQCYV